MASLDDLPSETLIEILSYLPCADLATTCRVTRRLQDVSETLLYKDLCLTETFDSNIYRPSLEILLRTLLTPGRETLRLHSRSLRFEWDFESRPTTPSPKDIVVFSACSFRLGLQYQRMNHVGQFLLLLHLLPSLRVLHIIPPIRRSSIATFKGANNMALVLATEHPPPTLQSLREFRCSSDDILAGVTPMTLMALMTLPSMNYVAVYVDYSYRSTVPQMIAAAHTSPVKKLRLTDCHLCTSTFSLILKLPIALTHFSYSAVHDGEFSTFMDALSAQQSSLQYLHLDFFNTVETDSEEEEEEVVDDASTDVATTAAAAAAATAGTSLREWPALHTLSCSLTPLLGKEPSTLSLAEVVPPGLRDLEILGDDYWSYEGVVAQVVNLLEQKATAVPCLQRLAVTVVDIDVEAQTELRVACEAVGVKLLEGSFCW